MKVLLLNGSPHEHGNTRCALDMAASVLQSLGIETELFWLGTEPVSGCIGCGACKSLGRCFMNDIVNEFCARMDQCDGLIVGTPVYFASPAGSLTAFLDRVFYSHSFPHKPAAAVTCARRAGTASTCDVLNRYFTIGEMPVIFSTYWNGVFGRNAGEAEKDGEGMQTVRNLAANMAWLLKCIEAGKAAGIVPPVAEREHKTNFIR